MTFANPILRILDLLYGFVISVGNNLQSVFLLYMRLTWGHQLILTGMAKLHNMEKVVQFFTSLHFGHPEFLAYLVAILELLCGIFLFLGLVSRLAAIPIAVIMFSALWTAHAPHLSNFRFVTEPHLLVAQEPFPYLITALIVFTFGPGKVSIDAWIKRWVSNQPQY